MNINDKNSTGKNPSPENQSPGNSVNEGTEKAPVIADPETHKEPENLEVCDQSMYASPCNDHNNVWSYHRTSDKSMSAMQVGLW